MSDDTATELLQALASADVDAAWRKFLRRYSPMIRRVIRRHETDQTRADECFEHVCGALSDDGFRRLRSFRTDGPARFDTWLVAVASNLCVDWRRRTVGRPRTPRSISRLPPLERQVYHCLYERGMSRAQCLELLGPQYPELDFATVAEINARVFALLPSSQRWMLSTRHCTTPASFASAGDEDDAESALSGLVDSSPRPEEAVASLQEQRRLQCALAGLPAEQRLMLRLRYEQDLTLAEVARLTGQTDVFRAHRRIQAALDRLAQLMREAPTTDGTKIPTG